MPDPDARQQAEDHYYAALDLMADGQLEKAVAEYQQSLAADPTFTEAMHGLARALQDLQRYDEAIAVAQRLAEIEPDDVLAHTSLSVLYMKKGMIPEAEAEGAKARVLGWKQQLKKAVLSSCETGLTKISRPYTSTSTSPFSILSGYTATLARALCAASPVLGS